MNIAQIRKYDVANGLGVRVSVFVSGCNFNCYNCFNLQYQDFSYGAKLNDTHILKIQNELDKKYIKGLSILGGEPLEHVDSIITLIESLKFRQDQDIWLWTGYKLEQVPPKLLNLVDYIVDGLYVESKKDLNLKFRGSSNQRIYDVKGNKFIT